MRVLLHMEQFVNDRKLKYQPYVWPMAPCSPGAMVRKLMRCQLKRLMVLKPSQLVNFVLALVCRSEVLLG